MIKSKADLLFYCEADRISMGRPKKTFKSFVKDLIAPDYIWRFQRLLRKHEYLNNTKKGIFGNIRLVLIKLHFRKLSLKLGFTIPINVFGPGLSIAHYGTIVVNANAKIGANARVQTCVVIGAAGGSNESATIGDNVYFGSGAKIIGAINIPSNTAIAANAVVNKSFIQEKTILAGVPSRIVGEIDIDRLLIKGSEKAK